MPEKDFDEWNILKKITNGIETTTKIRVGEIRWCKFGVNIGNEILGKGSTFHRPVLILKKFSGDVFFGLPLTTKFHTGDWYYQIIHDDITQTIILNQGRILDRKRLEEKLFEISEIELDSIRKSYCELMMRS